jgi:hypothetical protein
VSGDAAFRAACKVPLRSCSAASLPAPTAVGSLAGKVSATAASISFSERGSEAGLMGAVNSPFSTSESPGCKSLFTVVLLCR